MEVGSAVVIAVGSVLVDGVVDIVPVTGEVEGSLDEVVEGSQVGVELDEPVFEDWSVLEDGSVLVDGEVPVEEPVPDPDVDEPTLAVGVVELSSSANAFWVSIDVLNSNPQSVIGRINPNFTVLNLIFFISILSVVLIFFLPGRVRY